MLFSKEEKLIKIASEWDDIIRWLSKKILKNQQKYEKTGIEYHERIVVDYALKGWIDIIYIVYIMKGNRQKIKESRMLISENDVSFDVKKKLIVGNHDMTEELKSEIKLYNRGIEGYDGFKGDSH